MESIIRVENLSKEFRLHKAKRRDSDTNTTKHIVRAVDAVSFKVGVGESVAFIGPNGAGKSTTIKMLTGILYPSSGSVTVAGFNPHDDRRQLAFKIGTVFGQRSQLLFNLPVRDSFELFARMYEVPREQREARYAELIEQFDLGSFVDQPVRKLSLGQRMRSEIALSLLHRPDILFLDEPTIGLDIVAKRNLREVLNTINREHNTTIFLTSHDVGDIEAVTDRTMIITQGQVVLDMPTKELNAEYLTEKHITLELADEKKFTLDEAYDVTQSKNQVRCTIDTTKHSLNDTLQHILKTYTVQDLTVSNTQLEDIIAKLYQDHEDARS